MELFLIFISQFLCVFLLGFQSLMVRDHNIYGAMFGSTLIGTSQFFIFSIIGSLGPDKFGSIESVAFVLAGPLGIASSMVAYKRLKLMKEIYSLIKN